MAGKPKIGDTVFYNGHPMIIVGENEGAVSAAALGRVQVFQDGSDPDHEGYPFSTSNLTDADGNPLYGEPEPEPGQSESKAPKVTKGKD